MKAYKAAQAKVAAAYAAAYAFAAKVAMNSPSVEVL